MSTAAIVAESAPHFWSEEPSKTPGRRRIRAHIGGLRCSLCTGTIEKALGKRPGVDNVAVSLTHEQALIEVLFDSEALDAAAIAERFGKAGYQARVVSSNPVMQKATPTTQPTQPTGGEKLVSRSSPRPTARKWLSAVASVFSSVLAIVCPVCIPAVGAFLASVGLGFAVRTSVLQPLLIVLLAANLAALVWSVKLHRRWWVIVTGALGAAMIYAGRYVWFSESLLWVGAATLIGTSIANFRIKRACCRCEQPQAS